MIQSRHIPVHSPEHQITEPDIASETNPPSSQPPISAGGPSPAYQSRHLPPKATLAERAASRKSSEETRASLPASCNIIQFQQQLRDHSPAASQQYQNRQFAQHLIDSAHKRDAATFPGDPAEADQQEAAGADQSLLVNSRYLKAGFEQKNEMFKSHGNDSALKSSFKSDATHATINPSSF